MPPAKGGDVVFDIRHTAPQHRQYLEFEVNYLNRCFVFLTEVEYIALKLMPVLRNQQKAGIRSAALK